MLIEAPGPTNVLCSIGELPTHHQLLVRSLFNQEQLHMLTLTQTDTDMKSVWLSLKPDGSSDSWSSFWSNRLYSPLRTYTAPGTYTLTVSDRAGDGGAGHRGL